MSDAYVHYYTRSYEMVNMIEVLHFQVGLSASAQFPVGVPN